MSVNNKKGKSDVEQLRRTMKQFIPEDVKKVAVEMGIFKEKGPTNRLHAIATLLGERLATKGSEDVVKGTALGKKSSMKVEVAKELTKIFAGELVDIGKNLLESVPVPTSVVNAEWPCGTSTPYVTLTATGEHTEPFWWNVIQEELNAWESRLQKIARDEADLLLDEEVKNMHNFQCKPPCIPFVEGGQSRTYSYEGPIILEGCFTTDVTWVCTATTEVRRGCRKKSDS